MQGRGRVQQQGCLVASRFPVPPPCPPICTGAGTRFCASTWEGVHRDWGSSLSISPFVPRWPEQNSRNLASSSLNRAFCEIQTASSPPPGSNKHQRRCDKNRDMDNRGPALASTSHPRFELPVPVLAIHPHHISSPLLPLPAASITTSSGPNKSSCVSSSACSSPRHLAQGAPRT